MAGRGKRLQSMHQGPQAPANSLSHSIVCVPLQAWPIKHAATFKLNRNCCIPAAAPTFLWLVTPSWWQGPSWSSVDVDGHWRLLHYALRRNFAPLLVSGVHNAATGTVDIHVTSDLLHPLQGTCLGGVSEGAF